MPAGERLPWYAQRFEAVELNSSFYAVPERATVRRWCEATPDGFVMDVKLHRLLSRHAATLDSLPPDLRDEARTTARGRVEFDPRARGEVLDETLRAIEPLANAGKLGALLLQLTPAFSPKRNELAELEPLSERSPLIAWPWSCATAAGWTRSAPRRHWGGSPSARWRSSA